MEYASIRKEESEMEMETGMHTNLTHKDLVRMGLDRKGKWQYTFADLEALPEGIWAELIDGELFVRLNAPSKTHQELLGNLFFQIKKYVMEKEGTCQVYPAPFGVRIKNDMHNFVLPDISLICREDNLGEKYCHGAPDLVIEVVSPYRKMDYVRKLALYREAGVREYWIVDPKYERVTVYDLEHGKEPSLHPFTERILVGIYGDLYLNVTDASISLKESMTKERKAGHAEGLTEGMKAGEDRLAGLTAVLLREGRTDDLVRALTDAAYRETLYREYEK